MNARPPACSSSAACSSTPAASSSPSSASSPSLRLPGLAAAMANPSSTPLALPLPVPTPRASPPMPVPATVCETRSALLPSSTSPRSRLMAIRLSSTAATTAHLEAIREAKERGKERQTKQKVSRGNRAKAPPAKRLRSPTVPVSPLVPTSSTGIRMMLSPRLVSPSTDLARSSQGSPISPFIKKRNIDLGSSRRKRKLTSHIWKDFDPIYDNGILAQAQCIHCNQLFRATRDFGTSACGRHLKTCPGKAKLDQMVSQISSGVSLPDLSLKDWKFSC